MIAHLAITMFTPNRFFIALALSASLSAAIVLADSEPPPIKDFERLQQLIKPAWDESRWLGMNWLTDIWEARQKAAAEGKPILLWSGGGVPPLGGC